MITTDADRAFAALAVRLERDALTLAQARAETAALALQDPARWRSAALLWPLFGKG